VDVDLRKLRYFVAVAEECHFGRAADRLHIAQPVLSRQIRSLERELGVALFTRDRRGTELTGAGRQLLSDAVALLSSGDALVRRVRAAACTRSELSIGFMPGITLGPMVRWLRDRHPELDVRLLRTGWDDQVRVLHDGRADLSIVRLPIERRGLVIRPLFTEPRVVALPVDHRLAGKTTLRISDLAAEHLLQDPDAVPEWRDIADEVRTGDRLRNPEIRSVEEKLDLVAAGAGIVVIPASTAAFYTQAGVTTVPLEGVAPNEVAMAWPAGRTSPLITEFVQTAAALLPGTHQGSSSKVTATKPEDE
jgi:DNA-binding transcriptional LysR family regulator